MDSECAFKVSTSAHSGRSLIAARELPAGYQVVQERPLVLGPLALSVPVCLSCHSPISVLERCQRCQWPVCNQTCADDPLHLAECRVLAQDTKMIGVPTSSDPTPRYDLILIVRCLLLQERDPGLWDTLMSLESHWQKRKKEGEAHHMAAVKYFTKVCPTNHDEDIIHKVRGIIVTNCINSKTAHGVSLRGIYPTISLLNHSCRPTVALRSDFKSQLFVHTTVDLLEGDTLAFCYVPPGDPFWKRQRDLRDIYYFSCNCERCTERSEMGLHFSSLKCGKCKKGFIDPMLNKKKVYRCTACRYSLYQVKVMHINIAIQSLYTNRENDVKDVTSAMKLLREVHDKAHGKHYTWLECATVILKALSRSISMDAHRLRKQLWMRILDLYDTLEPGMTRRRGVSLLQLTSTSAMLAIQDFNIGRISKEQLHEEVRRCQDFLSEARQILLLEPPESTEQKWLMMEEKERRRLEEIREQIEELGERGLKLLQPDDLAKQEKKCKELEELTKDDEESEEEEPANEDD